jgi:hypothetical protein
MGCRFPSFPSYYISKNIPIAYTSIVNIILNWEKNIDFYELLIYYEEMESYTIELNITHV